MQINWCDETNTALERSMKTAKMTNVEAFMSRCATSKSNVPTFYADIARRFVKIKFARTVLYACRDKHGVICDMPPLAHVDLAVCLAFQ